jgi:predicted transcriptional regulator
MVREMEALNLKNMEMEKAMGVMFNLKSKLSMSARFVYVALMAVDKDQKLKHEELAEITDLSVITVKKAVKELKDNDLIDVKRAQYGSFYQVL